MCDRPIVPEGPAPEEWKPRKAYHKYGLRKTLGDYHRFGMVIAFVDNQFSDGTEEGAGRVTPATVSAKQP